MHTALIARWPGKISPDKRTDAFVQYADIAPTLIEAAGGEVSAHPFDGRSFLPLLRGKSDKSTRQYAYGVHNNIPEGPAYPVRTVSDGECRYIRNLLSDELYIEKHLMGWTGKGKLNNPYWATWVSASWQSPVTCNLVKRYQQRPSEQLYHTAKDPCEMTNLADDEEAAAIKARLRAELDRWLSSQGDPGVAQDTEEAIKAARRGEHLYGPR